MGVKTMVGQRFGRWLVLEEAGRDRWGKDLWKCLCNCGNEKVVNGGDLRRGKSKSCGCYKGERTSEISRINLTGQYFGRLLVLGFAYTKNGYAYWECFCGCGNMKIVCGYSLRSGKSRSCGCLQKELVSKANKVDIAGQRFERLLVVEEVESDKHNNILWKCKCDCGSVSAVSGAALRSGNTKSCGCLQKDVVSKMRRSETGKNNLNYNPNLTDEDRQNRRLIPGYNDWHKAVFERDNYTCQYCGKRGGKLAAHHLESYRDNPELRTTLENGITLCENCHNNFHHWFGYGNNTQEQFEEFFTQKNY